MTIDYRQLIDSIPNEVKFSDIVEFDKLDERVSAIGVLYSNILGVCDGYIEFCPDNEPPLFEEKMSWIWVIKPDLGNEILKQDLSNDLKLLIESYQKNEMSKWWEFINGN